jgi:hypothetical protein
MGLKIARFECNRIITSQNNSFTSGNNDIILPLNKNVLIKKVIVNCVFNRANSGIIINDWFLNLQLLSFTNNINSNDRPILINPTNNSTIPGSNVISLNKNNPFQNLNEIFGGFRLSSAIGLSNFYTLNNNTFLVNDSLNFNISIYYDN